MPVLCSQEKPNPFQGFSFRDKRVHSYKHGVYGLESRHGPVLQGYRGHPLARDRPLRQVHRVRTLHPFGGPHGSARHGAAESLALHLSGGVAWHGKASFICGAVVCSALNAG